MKRQMINVNVLYSGSEGNATVISDGNTNILIDAGANEKKLTESLSDINMGLHLIDAILITHEHTDHTKALYTVAKKFNIPIFTSLETAKGICSKKDASLASKESIARKIKTVEANSTYEIGSMLVTPFHVPHDVYAHGFKFEFEDGKAFCYATDTGCVTKEMQKHFEGSSLAVIESNHDKDMLINGTYADFLKQRILSDTGHLSNEIASRFALWLAQSGTEKIILAHLSKDNNTPTLAESVTRSRLDENGFSNIPLLIAQRFSNTGCQIL